MLQPRKESVVDTTGSGKEASKQVELESKVKECKRAHTLNQSMMLKVQLRGMIHCKSNSTILPPGE